MTDTLWYTRCPGPSAAVVAINLGWLEREFSADGIAVKSLAASGDPAVHRSHYRHTQPNSFRFGGYVPPLLAKAQGSDLKVIGLAWADRLAGVFALPDGPVRHPGDLRGRRLSLPVREEGDIDWWRGQVLAGYEFALKTAGLTLDDVELVKVPVRRSHMEDATAGEAAGQSLWGARSQLALQREEVAALIQGRVDAVYSDAALGALLQAFTGARSVIRIAAQPDSGTGDFGYPTVLTVSGGLLRERPDLVDRWVARLLGANDWALAHRDDARRIIARESGVPEDLVEVAHSSRVYGQLDVDLSPRLVAILRQRHDSLLSHKLIAAPIDFEDFIDPRPLEAARRRKKLAV
jgi:ABC-type nitrate/sulfonate/bicarbonate transport system substrate-binding protein